MKTRKAPRRILRRAATVDDVFDVALAGAGPTAGKATLVICARIGDALVVPPGYETTDCSECGQAVWISPDVVRASKRRGMAIEPLCNRCVSGSV